MYRIVPFATYYESVLWDNIVCVHTEPEAPVAVQKLTDAQLADEFAEQRLKVKAWSPLVNPHLLRFELLETELLARQKSKPAKDRIIVEGVKWTVPITACENRRKITKPFALYRRLKKLGETKLLKLYKITLDAIEKAIPDEKERKQYVTTKRTGPREIGEPVLKEAHAS